MRTPLQVTRAAAVNELTDGLRRERRSVDRVRFRAVLAVLQGAHVPAVAKMFSVAERAVRNWVHRYNTRGPVGLRDRRTGRRCRLSAEQQKRLRNRIRQGALPADGVCSLRGQDLRRILREEFHVEYACSSVYYLLHHQLRMSYLKPRPIHRKTDPVAQEAFKKTSRKSSRTSSTSTRARQSRSGFRTKAGSGSKAR